MKKRMRKLRWKTGTDIHGTTCVIAVVEHLARSLGCTTTLPLLENQRELLPTLPDWGIAAVRELKKSSFKSIRTHLTEPKGERNDPRRILGVCLGVIDRFALFFEHQAESLFEGCDLTKEQEARIERRFRDYRRFPEIEAEINRVAAEEPPPFKYGVRFKFTKKSDPSAVAEFFVEFYRGYSEGMGMILNSEGKWTWGTSRSTILESLLAFWPDIELMRTSNPSKTRVDLFEWLQERDPEVNWGNQESFDRICDVIGLVMTTPGGPQGPRNSH